MQRLFITFLFVFSSLLFAQDDFFEPKTTIGGYGELHYNYEKPEGSDATKTLDFHRFILFISHSFTEKWSFKSELELEHNYVAGGEKSGELELEQAYINYHHSESFGFQVGVILASVGLINEYHEPPLFLSVERPDYAKNIIPSTWFGNGAAIYGRFNGFNYKVKVLESLDGSAFSASGGIRGGRLKGYKANADDFVYNFSLNYDGFSGLQAGTSLAYNNAGVAADTSIGMTLAEIHANYDANNVILVAEYGMIFYDVKNSAFQVEQAAGGYIDLGYDISSLLNIEGRLIPWIRYTDYNTAAKVIGGGDIEKMYHISKWLLGLTYKPNSQIVFKADYGVQKVELNNSEKTLFNLGAGYMF